MWAEWLYKAGIYAYWGALHMAAPFHTKAQKMLAGRKGNFWQQLSEQCQVLQQPIVWFHCASLGEFEQARPVIEAFRQAYPQYKILLTFFSPSGYEVQKNYAHADIITYLPLDTAHNAHKFLEIVQPKIVFFVKYEFWYYYLRAVWQRQIPLFIFSAIFRAEQPFFSPYGTLHRQMLRCFTHIFVQETTSQQLLEGIGIGAVSVTGDTRFDRVIQIAQTPKALPLVQQFKQATPLLVVGSSWQEDIAVLAPCLQSFALPLKIVVAPHELGEDNLLAVEQAFHTRKVLRYSAAHGLSAQALAMYDVLLIDNIGLLSSLYRLADFAFVGGAYKDGLHNIVEAAVYGMPIYFGTPYYKKFQEALDLLAMGGAFSIKDTAALEKYLVMHYQNPTLRQHIGEITRQYVYDSQGSTQKILSFPPLREYLNQESSKQ